MNADHRPRIVFLGSDPIALPALEWMTGQGSEFVELVAIFTQPDRPSGRGQQVMANDIKRWALARALPVLQPERLTEDARVQLENFRPDLSVVMAYGHILRDPFIATPRLGTVNLHASILPQYRGASPIQSAIACGEKETGVALMRIVRQLDAGPVADVERVGIQKLDTALDVERKLAEASVPLLRRNLPKLFAGELAFAEQDASRATFCRRLTKADGALDFRESAESIAARINGLFPWPGCSFAIGGHRIKVGLARAGDEHAQETPGTVLASVGSGAAVRVATGRGVLELLKLQRPGGKMLSADEFLRGFPIAAGSILPSEAMPALVTTSVSK